MVIEALKKLFPTMSTTVAVALTLLITHGSIFAFLQWEKYKHGNTIEELEEIQDELTTNQATLKINADALDQARADSERLRVTIEGLNKQVEILAKEKLELDAARIKANRERAAWREKANQKIEDDVRSGETTLNEILRGLANE